MSSVMQLKPHPGADLYEKESQLNPGLVEEWEGEQYYKINTVVDTKMIYGSP